MEPKEIEKSFRLTLEAAQKAETKAEAEELIKKFFYDLPKEDLANAFLVAQTELLREEYKLLMNKLFVINTDLESAKV